MKKKFFALCLSIAMFGAFCSCALADDGNKTEKDSETKVEETVEKNSEIAASESELHLEKVYDSMCNSIIQEYCEPNNIDPEDFVWPEKSSIAWMYFGDLAAHHQMELMGLNTEFVSDYTPSDSEKSLMEITFNSILEWIDTNPEENTAYYGSILQELNPYHENIPAKITIADFEIESGCETDTQTTIDETVNNNSTEIVDENDNEIDTDFVSDITEEYDISAEQAESLYNIIAEQIVTEYLADYDMKPEDFVWPSTDFNDDESAVWVLLQDMISIKLIYLQSNLDKEPDIIEDYASLEQKSIDLLNCTYKAIISWYEENGSILPDYMMWQNYLPGNVTVDRLCNIIDRK